MQFGVRDAIDILIVTYMIYKLLMLTRETRAMQVLKGVGILFIAASVSELFRLTSITWILDQVIRAGSVALVVLFQPELRRALEQIGRGNLFHRSGTDENPEAEQCIRELVTAMKSMAAQKIGALILIEERTGLGDIIATGTKVDAMVTSALIENIFVPNTPLHDGATIIRGTRIVASGCFLPLSDNNTISRQLGTRHRAALGVSEVSDCHAFVVSEETGVISLAYNGRLTRYLDEESLYEILRGIYHPQPHEKVKIPFLNRRKSKND